MINSIQGTSVIGSNNPVNSPTGTAQIKTATPAETVDYKVSLNKEVISTLTYERTGSVGLQDKGEAVSVEALLSRLFERQGITYEEAKSGKTVGIDPQTRAEAQELISEDGYWGVNKTSERIFEFATAGAGGDPTKLEAIKAAIDKGFGKAANSFGGSLPDISSKTYDAVMKKTGRMGQPGSITIRHQEEKWGDTMFEAIQNAYPKVQENEPVFSNVVPIKSSPAPAEQQQAQKQSQKQQQAGPVAEQEVTQDLLDQLAEDIGAMHSVDLQFSVQEKSGRTVIKVMDKSNSEVIREIPSKTVQALAAKIDEVLGLLFDTKV